MPLKTKRQHRRQVDGGAGGGGVCKGDTNSREIFWKIPSISLKHAHSRACKRALTQPPTRAEAEAAAVTATATATLSLASVT